MDNRAQTGVDGQIILCELNNRIEFVQITLNRSVFYIGNIRKHVWKPRAYPFTSAVISICLRIRALHWMEPVTMYFIKTSQNLAQLYS